MIRRSWDANAAAWTTAVRERRIESRKLGTDAAVVAAVLRARPASVLDVGCGEGWLAAELASQGVRVTGIDASAELIARARERGGADFDVVSYDTVVRGDWKPPEAEYDAVVCNFSLFDEDLVPLLSSLGRFLSAHGRLVIQTVHPLVDQTEMPYRDGWREETFDAFRGTFTATMPWYFRTVDSWLSQVATSGLRVMEREEPLHPDTGRPLSLLLICERAV